MAKKTEDRLAAAIERTEREMHALITKLNTQSYSGIYAMLADAEKVGELASRAKLMRDAGHAVDATEVAARRADKESTDANG